MVDMLRSQSEIRVVYDWVKRHAFSGMLPTGNKEVTCLLGSMTKQRVCGMVCNINGNEGPTL